MRIHHLNCGTCCPLGGRWLDGRSRGLTARLVCHCLLIETGEGLVLVDTGLGMRDVTHPLRRLSKSFLLSNRFRLLPEETAVEQIRALGFNAADVQHIVLTHLDFDHAGGAEDFPDATIHVMKAEYEAAREQTRRQDRQRYRPVQWNHLPRWQVYEAAGESWKGFSAVRKLAGLPPEILLVSLPGHTRGHAGIAVDVGDGWLLHAGDAYVHHAEMERDHDWPRIARYQGVLDVDRDARLANQARLRELSQDADENVTVFCAHDPVEFDELRRRSAMPDQG